MRWKLLVRHSWRHGIHLTTRTPEYDLGDATQGIRLVLHWSDELGGLG